MQFDAMSGGSGGGGGAFTTAALTGFAVKKMIGSLENGAAA